MTILARHLLSQRRVFAALGQVVADALLRSHSSNRASFVLPGPEVCARLVPPSEALIADYVTSMGGNLDVHAGKIPAHLFPHWAFPALVKSLRTTRYPLTKALNAGCRLQLNAALSSAHELDIRAQLIEVRDEGKRALLHARVTTGQSAHPEALVADLYALVPSLRHGSSENGAPKPEREKPHVPGSASALQRFTLSRSAGLHFALLTGDVNPIHWLAPYARLAGFAGPILHGFALLARSMEALVHTACQGAPERLHVVDVRFTRPLTLPAEVTLYTERDQLFVGDAPKAPAYMVGTFSLR